MIPLSEEIDDTVRFIQSESRTPEEIDECIANACEYIWRKYHRDDVEVVEKIIRDRLV